MKIDIDILYWDKQKQIIIDKIIDCNIPGSILVNK